MSNNTRTIRPGWLLGLKTQVKGGVRYFRSPLEFEGDNQVKWTTTRVTDDPDELERAQKARSRARRCIEKVAAKTAFNVLLCARQDYVKLDAAEAAARAIVAEHNDSAKTTWIEFYLMRGEVADNDEQAIKMIASELRDRVEEMDKGIAALDAEQIRRAAREARRVLGILSDDKREIAKKAIAEATMAAREIVRRIEKKGEDATTVLASLDKGAIQAARVAFIDMDDVPAPAPQSEALPQTQVQRVAALSDADLY